jgi:hypothetical protein
MTPFRKCLPVALALLLPWSPATTLAWMVQPELGYGLGIAMTPTGDVLTCGHSRGADGDYDFSIRLHRASDGTDVWHYRADGTAGAAGDVTLDGAGNVIAAGTTDVGVSADVRVVKLTPDGVPLWTTTIDSATQEDDRLEAMAVGSDGDVAVTGTFAITYGVDHLYSVARLDGATGAVEWQHDVPAAERSHGVTVGFDAAGDVLTTGALFAAGGSDVVALKLDGATGAEQWRTVLDDGGYDSPSASAIDAAGDFYVGVSESAGKGFTVYKLSGTDGGVLWRFDHRAPKDGDILVLALDGRGHVYAGGFDYNQFVHQRTVLAKLSAASGVPVWTRRYQGMFFNTIGFDPSGEPILGGSNRTGLFTFQKVRASDGRKRWQRRLPGDLYHGGSAQGIVTDAIGDVYVVGGDVGPRIPPVGGHYSYTAVKACAKDGRIGNTNKCR